jgi:spore coat protein U-like protein
MRPAFILLALALAAPLAPAAGAVQPSCTVSATPVTFGIYVPTSASPTDSTGTVTVDCAWSTGYAVALSTGASGSYASRQMRHGGARLAYQLYADAARTTVWGNGSGGTIVEHGDCDHSFPVYGRIPARQLVTPGAYLDTIVVTVTF